MKLKSNFFVFLGLSICVSGCAGPRWEKQPATGDSSQMVIRTTRSAQPQQKSATPQQVVPQQVIAQVDSLAKQNAMQEQLVKQVARMSVTDFKDYKVGPEDLLVINVLNAEKLNTEARVNGQGAIRLLLLGDVKVADLSPTEIAQKLAQQYHQGQYLINPQVSVAVKEYRHQQVAVTGAVNKPDSYPLIGPRSLLEVLGGAGGLSANAGEVVHVIRSSGKSNITQVSSAPESFSPATETVVIDLNRLLLKGDTQLNVPIKNGDVVHVPFALTAYVLGAVNKPGGVFIKDNLTLAKAVAQAGGPLLTIASSNVTILRMDEVGQRTMVQADLEKIKKGQEADVPLKENDIVVVQESSARRFMYDFKLFLPGSFGLSVPGMMQ